MNAIRLDSTVSELYFLEICLYLATISITAIAMDLQWIGVENAARIVTVLLCVILVASWRRFQGGRHPGFLFLCMLLLFQAGRLIAFTAGNISDPFRIVVQTQIPFDVTLHTARITLIVITLSATTIYIFCSWNFLPHRLDVSLLQPWRAPAYYLLWITLPFLFYKNFLYLHFIYSHGGYLAVYTQSDALLASAGTFIRGTAFLCYQLCLILFVLEDRRRHLRLLTLLLLAASAMELLIGFRGKVFLLLLTLWYVANLKRGQRLRAIPLISAACAIGAIASLAAGIREQNKSSLLSPLAFIAGQGVSMGVTEMAIEQRNTFSRNAGDYLIHSLTTAYRPTGQFKDKDGYLFTDDLSLFLNRKAFAAGYSTGSSYLADSYLAGGVTLTLIASGMIGWVLRLLHRASTHAIGGIVLILLLPSIIYLPRSGLLEPLAVASRVLLSTTFIFAALWSIRNITDGMAVKAARLRAANALRHNPNEI